MAAIPEKLQAVLDDFESIHDRAERIDLLIETADRFNAVRVPETVAQKPYDDAHKAPACESEAYVWAVDQPDGTLKYYFDVLNPQGLSAMAMAVLIDETLSGAPLEAVAAVEDDIVFRLFGREISMGKGAGLMGILTLVRHEAKKRLQARN
ncbi:SufE family protein [Oscillatoria laete-virens NRMC-F 0139]|jgi:cysteine desulfuration protein SufE|nr:SufE family protein [Oscillatoria laete-virens]MDL5054059.1 SufE family protein [Oscillatoria laete-virens NRMC-F 0139]